MNIDICNAFFIEIYVEKSGITNEYFVLVLVAMALN